MDENELARTRYNIVRMLDNARKYYIGTYNKWGFEIELWKTGIKISRPKEMFYAWPSGWRVLVIRWWLPRIYTYRDGASTSTE